MLPVLPRLGGSVSRIGRGCGPSLNVITDAAYCGTAPTNAADLNSWVVPVLPSIGRLKPLAAAYEVPPGWSSLLRPVTNVFASGSSTACSQGFSRPLRSTGWPFRSVTEMSGVGGHHTPPLINVAATFASSSGLVGAGPRVSDALPGLPFGLLLKWVA